MSKKSLPDMNEEDGKVRRLQPGHKVDWAAVNKKNYEFMLRPEVWVKDLQEYAPVERPCIGMLEVDSSSTEDTIFVSWPVSRDGIVFCGGPMSIVIGRMFFGDERYDAVSRLCYRLVLSDSGLLLTHMNDEMRTYIQRKRSEEKCLVRRGEQILLRVGDVLLTGRYGKVTFVGFAESLMTPTLPPTPERTHFPPSE